MELTPKQKSALLFIGAVTGAAIIYRQLSKRETVSQSAAEVVKVPVKVGKEVIDVAVHPVKTVKHPVKAARKIAGAALNAPKKGSPEAKAFGERMRAARAAKKAAAAKGGEATAALGQHKGHRTKRGLAQDQKLQSSEPHEIKQALEAANEKTRSRLRHLQ